MSGRTVCVIGAGTAGLEGLLSAREALGHDFELQLIAPDRGFRYRPMTRDSLFRPTAERTLAIADVVAHASATWVEDRADVIRETEHTILTRDGNTVPFDFLLLAAGAQSARTLTQGYVWQRDSNPGFLDQIIAELRDGTVRTVGVVVPRGARWPLPAYELALVLAWSSAGTGARITLVTAEERPLGVLGHEATDAVTRELEAAGVRVISGMTVVDAAPDGRRKPLRSPEPADLVLLPEGPTDQRDALNGTPIDRARLHIGSGAAVEFDRLISLPTVIGPHISGVATDAAGFIEVDASLKVRGSKHVWAAGRCIAAALEHSALAARQADAAIAAIAAVVHGDDGPHPGPDVGAPELTGMLLTGQRDRWLAENPEGTREPSTRCLWWPPGRAVGPMLAKEIAAWNPSIHGALPGHPDGLVIHLPVALGPTRPLSANAATEVSARTRADRMRDIENRQLMAVDRLERETNIELHELEDRLKAFSDREREVVRTLRHDGYLLHYDDRAPARR